MTTSTQRLRMASLASFAAACLFWAWLLAVQPVNTAAMRGAYPLLTWLRGCWSGLEDMGHGAFLPLVSLYVLYLRRKDIVAALGQPDYKGLLCVLAGVGLFWVGLKTEEVRICLAALVLWAWAVPYALWGRNLARQLVFPVGYLLLSIPRWDVVVNFTVKLRVLAAAVAVGIANGIGIATERVGTGIHSTAGSGFNLDVAEACSGLRSIFAMTALAAAYAFFTQKSLLRQWALFLFAVPVAIVGNVVRIVTITIIAAWLGEKAATGFYHDYSGYIVFLVGILLLVELGRQISRFTPPARWRAALDRVAPRPPAASPAREPSFAPALLVLPPLFILGTILMVRMEPPVRLEPIDFLPSALPARVDHWEGSPLLFCHNEQCMAAFSEKELNQRGAAPLSNTVAQVQATEPWTALRDLKPAYRCPACGDGELYTAALGEQKALSGDACVLRSRYEGGGASPFTVTLVISGTSRNSIHNPQLCLPAQGFTMNRVVDTGVPVATGTGPIKLVSMTRGGADGRIARLSFAYWFFTEDRQTASVLVRMFWTAWERAFHHRAERWVMITVLSNRDVLADPAGEKELAAFCSALIRELKPEP